MEQDGPENGPAEERQLIPRDPETSNLLVQPTVKLRCIAYMLALIVVGFITSVIETEEFISNCSKKNFFQRNEWVCWSVKIGYSLSAIAVIISLQWAVFVRGKVPKAAMPHPNQDNQDIVLKDMPRYVKTPQTIGSYPSKLFIATFIIFAAFTCLCGGVEIVCGALDAQTNLQTELPEVFRRVLLVIFCVMQTRLFLVHYRHSAQCNLSFTWFCGCHLVAMNIAFWFFNVGLEVREIGLGCGNESYNSNSSYCENYNVSKFTKLLYPFGIEYYVMGAFIAYSLVANTGCLAVFLQSRINDLSDNANRALSISIRSLLRPGLRRNPSTHRSLSEFSIIRRHSGSFLVGLSFVVGSLIVSVFAFVKTSGADTDDITKCIFYSALILLYFSGFIITMMLLRSLNDDKRAELSFTHLTDRLLLWLGAIAIVVNDFYNFWTTSTEIKDETGMPLASSILLGVTCLLNIMQSLMQVYALECALLRKFKDRVPGLEGRALLNILICLNAAEWIINTICFTLFFKNNTSKSGLVLSLVTIPLQVFFRFHSAACIHEFKRHCNSEEHSEDASADVRPDLEIAFPTLESLIDSFESETDQDNS